MKDKTVFIIRYKNKYGEYRFVGKYSCNNYTQQQYAKSALEFETYEDALKIANIFSNKRGDVEIIEVSTCYRKAN